MKYLVIDVGGTYTKYAVMNEDADILDKAKVPTVKSSLEDFTEMLVQIFREHGRGTAGIALSAPGMIDCEKGYMHNGGSIFCIRDFPVAKVLQERCGVPVTVENDAKCAGLAEVWKGSLADCRNSIAMIIGTAVGGAVVCDRKVLHGSHFMAGEFSYILTNADDTESRQKIFAECGGVPKLLRLVKEKKKEKEPDICGERVFELALKGDREVLDCLREYCRGLAVQIMNMQFIFDPERIAIGGGISVQPLFVQTIREELERLSRVYPYPLPLPEVTNCQYFNDSNLIGALYVHLSKYTKGE